MKLKYNNKQKFEPIVPDHDEWPVAKLSRNREAFIQKVAKASIEQIKVVRSTSESLIKELETTRYFEKLRLQKDPWEVDPDDEMAFWKEVKSDLMKLSGQEDTNNKEEEVLERIVTRYSTEIAGNFKHSYYRFTRSVVTFGFSRLLNSQQSKFWGLFKSERTLRDKIRIRGHINLIRKLAKKGTIVMVPTHFSNLDSILVGWVIHELGLPPFIYGAGLNLFNLGLFAYFMNSVGAYKVDRRKKNRIYLETLKTYSNLAIQDGIHSLFFPGGTRSRSGKIENSLKLGLLGTALDAQRSHFNKNSDEKIYIVPVVLNYNFVLEAPSLINQYLERTGQEKYYIDTDNYASSFKIVKFLMKFFTKPAEISVTIGHAMDLMGNYVDEEGNSFNKLGQPISVKDYFMKNDEVISDKQRDQEFTRLLSDRIVHEFHKFNEVLPSHLVAFVGYRLFRKQFAELDLYSFLRLPGDELSLEYDYFMDSCRKVVDVLHELENEDKLLLAPKFEDSLEDLIETGLTNLGMYHATRPLMKNAKGQIVTRRLNLLYFYHNRLDGYNLKHHV
ncbi:MAG: 1-acyl-sn-glycerol-3-phosphate acyltransferase [Bacteroidota bacterium]